jgi:biotin transporter BioY
MIVAFSPISILAGSTFRSAEPIRPVFGILIASFVGVLTDHIVGSAIGIWYFSLRPEIWYSIMPIYPVERIVALVLTTMIATPVYASLKRAKMIDLLNKASQTRGGT